MSGSRAENDYQRDFAELQSYREFRKKAAEVLKPRLNRAGWHQEYNDHNWCHDKYPNGFYGADYSGVDTLVAMALCLMGKNHPNQFDTDLAPGDLAGMLGKISGIQREVK